MVSRYAGTFRRNGKSECKPLYTIGLRIIETGLGLHCWAVGYSRREYIAWIRRAQGLHVSGLVWGRLRA